jgi:RNA polymerase sigma-70 factor (ECF subfamily)
MRPFAPAIPAEIPAAQTPAMDEDSFRLFYNRTARPLRAFLGATLHDPSLADDILQETFLRFLEAQLPADMQDEHRKNYLFRIATNLMRDYYRNAKSVPLSETGSGEKPAEDIVRREDMRQIMGELKPRERELLWLAYVEQFSHHEIATMMGAKTESIRPMLARARQSLADLLRLRTGASK